jgi:magnesium-transporting ATPase (P-type)
MYVSTSSNSSPASVQIILAVAFAAGISANVFLLVRLLGRTALISTLGALFCLVIRLLTNIAGTIVLSNSIREVGLPSQSIMPVVSIILAAFIIVLLTLDGVRTRWYKNGERVEVTEKQKSLNTAFTWFIFVLIVGTVVFRYVH